MIHYVVVFYLGPRRNPSASPVAMIHEHARFLSEADEKITSCTVVVNKHGGADLDFVRGLFNEYAIKIPVRYIERENVGYSYAGWSEAVSTHNGNEEFHFLMEDDYIPSTNDFYVPFLKEMSNPWVGYVCCVAGGAPYHAAMSIGMLRDSSATEAARKFGAPFYIAFGYDYVAAEMSQMNFLRNITEVGYTFTDIANWARQPFFHNSGFVIDHGNSTLPAVIEPIVE